MNYRNENATPRDRYEGYSLMRNMNCPHADGNSVCHTKSNDRIVSPRAPRNVSCPKNCGADNGFLKKEAPLAMVYSPKQVWKDLYDPHTALHKGTIFKELDLPFYPTPCRRKECYPCQYR